MVDAESADDRDEKRSWELDVLFTRLLPANKSLLQHIFRVRNAADHAIGDGKEQTSVLIKSGKQNRLPSIRLSLFARTRGLFSFAHRYTFRFDHAAFSITNYRTFAMLLTRVTIP